MAARFFGWAMAVAVAAASLQPYAIDAARSKAEFSVSHIWVDRVTGTVPILRGSVTVDPGSEIPSSTTAVLDATKISTGEPDRDKSLESPDFFDAGTFPTWSFVSTKIVPKNGRSFEMDGDLTIHGVTQPERLSVTTDGAPPHLSYHATAQIDRHAFGMAKTQLDPTISATVDVTLDVVLK
jgi:polyisoprenoid-binding protein YceI